MFIAALLLAGLLNLTSSQECASLGSSCGAGVDCCEYVGPWQVRHICNADSMCEEEWSCAWYGEACGEGHPDCCQEPKDDPMDEVKCKAGICEVRYFSEQYGYEGVGDGYGNYYY